MGGLRRLMPVTFMTYAIGMMALSGVPFFFSGGWTKEEILHATAHWHASRWPYYLMLAGVILTALYMTRQMIYVFFGQTRSCSGARARKPTRNDDASDRAGALRNFIQRSAYACVAMAARISTRRTCALRDRAFDSADAVCFARAR